MSSPRPPYRLQKWPFLLADATLLAAAWFIASQSPRPLRYATALAIAGSVALAAVCGLIPFIAEYARRQDEAFDDRQHALESLARTVATAAEQIGISAAGFNQIAELAQKNLKHAEQLPQRMQEQIAEAEARYASARADDREELERELASLRSSESERLEGIAEKIARAAADLSKAETAAPAKSAAPVEPAAIVAVVPEPPPAPSSPAPVAPAEPVAEPPPAPAPEPAPRKRPAKKAPPPSVEDIPLLVPEPPPPPKEAPSEFSQVSPEDAAPAVSISADGATRLLVTAYIGIGNRLFIRGEGPGLSWEQGVPLQFVSIGKWRWETAEATAPVRFKLFKNDRDECASPASPSPLEPGRQQEFTASF